MLIYIGHLWQGTLIIKAIVDSPRDNVVFPITTKNCNLHQFCGPFSINGHLYTRSHAKRTARHAVPESILAMLRVR